MKIEAMPESGHTNTLINTDATFSWGNQSFNIIFNLDMK